MPMSHNVLIRANKIMQWKTFSELVNLRTDHTNTRSRIYCHHWREREVERESNEVRQTRKKWTNRQNCEQQQTAINSNLFIFSGFYLFIFFRSQTTQVLKNFYFPPFFGVGFVPFFCFKYSIWMDSERKKILWCLVKRKKWVERTYHLFRARKII